MKATTKAKATDEAVCSTCGKTFKNGKARRIHQRVHGNEPVVTATPAVYVAPPAEKPVKRLSASKAAVARDAAKEAKQAAPFVVTAIVTTPAVPVLVKPVATEPVKVSGDITVREGSKRALVIGLIQRQGGVTRSELATATAWSPVFVHGFVAGTIVKRFGLKVVRVKDAATRDWTYSL